MSRDITAGVGAILRRRLARLSANPFVQPFCAALLAGFIGGIAVRYDLSSSLRLVAVCPCMILIPGPHILNGALDLVTGRINLGAARLLYAGVIIAAISMGLLIGLALLGVSLPVEEPGRVVPLWQDVIAAGVAVAAYSIFFSTPTAMLPWPIAIGMLAHALHWATLATLGFGAVTAALAACVVVGLILAPVACAGGPRHAAGSWDGGLSSRLSRTARPLQRRAADETPAVARGPLIPLPLRR